MISSINKVYITRYQKHEDQRKMTSYITCVVLKPFNTKYLNEVAAAFPGVTFTCNTPKLLRSITSEWTFSSKKMHFTLEFNKEDGMWVLMARIPAIFDDNRLNKDGIKDTLVDLFQSWSYDCKNPLSIQVEEDEELEVQIEEPVDEPVDEQPKETKSSSSKDDAHPEKKSKKKEETTLSDRQSDQSTDEDQ